MERTRLCIFENVHIVFENSPNRRRTIHIPVRSTLDHLPVTRCFPADNIHFHPESNKATGHVEMADRTRCWAMLGWMIDSRMLVGWPTPSKKLPISEVNGPAPRFRLLRLDILAER